MTNCDRPFDACAQCPDRGNCPDEPATLDDMFGCDPWDEENIGRHAASRESR